MKSLIGKIFNGLGFEIHRKENADVKDISMYYDYYDSISVETKKFYNVGAGNFSHPAWTNIDNPSDWYRKQSEYKDNEIIYDLLSLKPLPIETKSAEIVYSSHTVEHITDEAAQNLFNESYRILKKGGILRITTPNIDLEYAAYMNNDRNFFYWIDTYSLPKEIKRVGYNRPLNEASTAQIFLEHFASSTSLLFDGGSPEKISDEELAQIFNEMEYESALNYCTSKCPIDSQIKNPGNHINWWNKDKMIRMFKKAGFENVYLSGYGQSLSPALRNVRLFDNTHPKISLYVEAKK